MSAVASPKVLLSLSCGEVVPWVKNSRSLSVRVWWCVCVCEGVREYKVCENGV